MIRLRNLGAVVMGAALLATLGGVAGASNPDPQANQPQVAGDATSNITAVFPTNKSNEPTIAVDVVHPSVLLAGANDEQQQPPCGPGPVRGPDVPTSDCSFFPWIGTSGLYRSLNGGTSWTNLGLIDDYWPNSQTVGSRVLSDGDPVIVIGPKPIGGGKFSKTDRRAYYVMLGAVEAAKGLEYIIVSHSDDFGGAGIPTWSDPVIASTKTSSSDFNDKNWAGVDDNPASPYFGRLYVSWTEFRSATATGNGNEPVMVASSTNGGDTFGAPKQLSPAGNNGTGNGRQGSSIATGPDGTVYVAFEQGSSQVVSVSRDGGKNWTRPGVIGAVTDIADPLPGANFRTSSFVVIDVDQNVAPGAPGGTVYATWVTDVGGRADLVVTSSSNRAATWSTPTRLNARSQGDAFFPGLSVAPNGRVDIAYQAMTVVDPATFGIGNAAIDSYAVSKPKDGAWSAPNRISSVSSDPAASSTNALGQQFWGDYNSLVSTDTTAWFIFTDSRHGVGCAAVDEYQKSLIASGLASRSDGKDRRGFRNTGIDPALTDPPQKPAPPVVCPSQFGNTDSRVAVYEPAG